MGCRFSKLCTPPAEAYRVGEALPETSNMGTEELLRRGIASAQEASGCARRERRRHVLLARSYLTAALQRYSRGPGGSPEISAHLLAVLLKLGEDAQSIQGILADTGLFDAHPSVSRGESPTSQRSSSGSSVEVNANAYSYDEMKENLLPPDSSDEENLEDGGNLDPPIEVDQASFANFTELSWPKLGTEDSLQEAERSSEQVRPSSPSRSPMQHRSYLRDAVQDAAAAAALTPAGSPMRLGRKARSRYPTIGSQASDSESSARRFPEIKEIGPWKIDEGHEIEPNGLEALVLERSRHRKIEGDGLPSPHKRTLSGAFDTLSVVASGGPSVAPSPHVGMALAGDVPTDTQGNSLTLSPCPSDADILADRGSLLVRVLSPVDGKEEQRFRAPLQADSEQQFLKILDLLCMQHVGQPLAGLNWLVREHDADRWQRRKCDVRMVEELFDEWQIAAKDATRGAVLHLCTIPVQPASELPRGKVRLKRLTPLHVCQPMAIQLETTQLEVGPVYSVAFTSQWSNMTYMAEATVLPNKKGVEVMCPWQIFNVSSSEGLFDVHLVIDHSSRSKNHQTLTVGSAESELDLSSAKSESASSFVPINRKRSLRHEHNDAS